MRSTIIVIVVATLALGIFLSLRSPYITNDDLLHNLPAAVAVPFTALATGAHSTVSSRVNYLITTPEELAELWKFLKEPPPVPTVDFNMKLVAAVFAGKAPTAGYAITVADIEDSINRVVNIELTKPGEGCLLAQSVTAPYQIIELPKTPLSFTHSDTWKTKACPQ